jgi:hypothetical protein
LNTAVASNHKAVWVERLWAPAGLLVVTLLAAWCIQRGLIPFLLVGGVSAIATWLGAHGRGVISSQDVHLRWARGQATFSYADVTEVDSSSMGTVLRLRNGTSVRIRLSRAANEHLATFLRDRVRLAPSSGGSTTTSSGT